MAALMLHNQVAPRLLFLLNGVHCVALTPRYLQKPIQLAFPGPPISSQLYLSSLSPQYIFLQT